MLFSYSPICELNSPCSVCRLHTSLLLQSAHDHTRSSKEIGRVKWRSRVQPKRPCSSAKLDQFCTDSSRHIVCFLYFPVFLAHYFVCYGTFFTGCHLLRPSMYLKLCKTVVCKAGGKYTEVRICNDFSSCKGNFHAFLCVGRTVLCSGPFPFYFLV